MRFRAWHLSGIDAIKRLKSHSAKWSALAYGYLNDIIYSVDRFIVTLLAHVCVDRRAREARQSTLYDGLMKCYEDGMKHVAFLLHVERNEAPSTIADNFSSELGTR